MNRVTAMSNDKPRLVEITDAREYGLLMAHQGELGIPHLLTDFVLRPGQPRTVFVDADELRAWRKLRESQNQSAAEPK